MKRMRIGDRAGSGAVLVAFAAELAAETWFRGAPHPAPVNPAWNPCSVWVNYLVQRRF